jgi:hypothetical protein
VLALLSAESLSTDELMIGRLVHTVPDAPDLIGRLLAAVLVSGPHHHEGAELLRILLRQLELTDDPAVTAGRLGTAVFCHWSPPEQQVLIPKLANALRTSAADAEVTRNVIGSFLRSIDTRR